jgi:hypothetical protein
MPEKAIITNTVTGDRIPVMFNPEEYTLNRDVNYAQTGVRGLGAPIIQFVHGNMQTLQMELLVDTYEAHSEGSRVLNSAGENVRNLTEKIIHLMDIEPTIHAPPVLIFSWGLLSFRCVLASASQRFIMFLPDGTPVRARLQVTFNGFTNVDFEAKALKQETADFSKIHVVSQGETASSIAGEVYGNPALWRPIALRNGLDDPRHLAPGLRLVIPQLPFRDPESAEVHQ